MEIYGNVVDDKSRCVHYHSEKDIVAIKMKCCNKFYACITCHNEIEQHKPLQWTTSEFETKAIICGGCKTEMTITTYLECQNKCPNCSHAFNEKCSQHYHFYFEM